MMAQKLNLSVVQVRDSRGIIQGTGFIIDSRTVVTCAHVVVAAGVAPGDSLTIAFASNGQTCSAQVIEEFWRTPEQDDIAILRLRDAPPANVEPLILGSSHFSSNHKFSAFGYPAVGDVQGVWAQGTILGSTTNGSGISMLQIRAQEIVEGMSGAPIFDTEANCVVGMVTATYYPANGNLKLRDAAFATPVETILQTYPHVESLPPPRLDTLSPAINQAPPLPLHFVPRPEIMEQAKHRLLSGINPSPGRLNVSALLGLGGIGKSTIAAALAYDPDVRHRFEDGILWATVGQQPDLLHLLSNWIQTLGDYDYRPTSIEAASNHLKNLLQHKAVLLVLDDVWDSAHIKPLGVSCCHGHILITTRRFDVAEEAGATIFRLEVMSPVQTLHLLAARMNRGLHDDERSDALRLAEAVGFLPLALELAAARVARGTSWSVLRQALEKEVAQLEALETPRRRRRERSQVEASFNLSLKALQNDDEETRRAFIWLGILPEDIAITAPMVTTLWQMDEAKSADTLEILWNDALLLPGAPVWIDGQEWPSYRLHDLLRDIARRLLTMPPPGGLGLSLPAVHATLLERYKRRTQNGLWHTLPPDGYIHSHLVWHMEQANQLDQIHALLAEETPSGRNGWYHAKEQLGQTAGFLADVNRAALVLHQQYIPSETIIGLQIRYALIAASLNSLARNVPLSLLVALVEKKLWTPAQGLAYAQQLFDLVQQAKALVELSAHTIPGIRKLTVQKALDVARQINDSWQQTETLMDMAERLAKRNQSEQALLVVNEINNDHWQAEALTRLIPHLPDDDLRRVLDVARHIDEEEYRVEVLAELIPRLPKSIRGQVQQEALLAAQSMSDEERLTELLAKLAPHLPRPLLLQTLEIAHTVEWEGARAEILAELGPYLPNPHREQTLLDAIAITKNIQFDELRGQTLVKLAPHLPEKLLTRAVANAWQIKSEKTRAKTLAQLAAHLPQELQEKAYSEILQAVENTTDRIKQVSLAVTLAPYLPTTQKNRVLQTALNSVKLVKQNWKRADLLRTLTPQLPAHLLNEALVVAQNIQDTEGQTNSLSAIAAKMAECGQSTDALATTRRIKNNWPRAKTLANLARHLPENQRRSALLEALEIALSIQNEIEQAAALAGLAPHLAEMGYADAAIEAVQNIWYEQWQARALAGVAPHLPEAQLVEALHLAQTIRDSTNRTEALVGLAPHLAQPLLLNALQSVQSIHDEQRRAEALLGLVPYLPDSLKNKAMRGMLTAVRLGWDQPKQVHVLAELAPQLSSSLRAETLQQMNGALWQIPNENEQANIIVRLAPYLPQQFHQKALDALKTMRQDSARVGALLGLAPYLSPQEMPQVISLATTLTNETQRARALMGLMPYLSATHLESVLETLTTFQDDTQKANVLARIIPYTPENFLPVVTQLTQSLQNHWQQSDVQVELSLRFAQFGQPEKALKTAEVTWDNVKRAVVLSQLYPYLPFPLNEQTLKDAVAAFKNIWYAKWQAEVLVELAPHLPETDRLELLQAMLATIVAVSDDRKRAEALAPILAHLPVRLMNDALSIIQSIQHQPSQTKLLAQIIPAVDYSRQQELLTMIRQVIDPKMRTVLLVKLALYLPKPEAASILKDALEQVWAVDNRERLEEILEAIVPILTQLPQEQLADVWQDMLPHLGQRQRKNLLSDINTLEPIIFSLGGPECMAETSRAIQDIGRWWP